jgi:hypothetical protein
MSIVPGTAADAPGANVPAAAAAPSRTIPPSHVGFCSDPADDPGQVWRSTAEPAEPVGKGAPEAKEYATFIKELLEAEVARGTTMETRAVAIVTASGTLVTLLLALAALVTRVTTFQVPVAALVFAGISAGLFAVSACYAMLAITPRRAWGLKPACLGSELWDRWADPADDAVAKTTATRLALWQQENTLTQRKAVSVFTAAVFQFGAVAALAIAVFVVLALV